MQQKRNTLPSVLLAIISTLGILVATLITGILLASTIRIPAKIDSPTIRGEIFTNYAIISLAVSISIVLVLTFNASLQYLRKKASKPLLPLRRSTKFTLTAVWFASLIAGYFSSQDPRWYPALAAITVVSIWLPILLLISLARAGLPRSTKQRELGTFTLGVSISPLIIIALESVLIIIIALIVFILLGLQNPLPQQLPQMLERLSSASGGIEQLEMILLELMQEPLIAGGVFLALGVVAPMIEEIFKPMAIWFLLNRPLRDHEGYALGLISGGAFALLESAGMVIQMEPTDWLTAIVLRAATGVLHIGLSGLVGFGLVKGKNIRKPSRGVLFLLLAGALHGAWNSLALYSGLAAIPTINTPDLYTPNTGTIISIGLMVLIFAGVIVINIFINRYIRRNISVSLSPS